MSNRDRPLRHPAAETAVLGDEAVIYDERTGTVHHLNPPATAIWELLDGRSIGEVVAVLAETTHVPPDIIRRDVLQALSGLDSAGLLEFGPAASG
jgi:PqqD family protein of HPr-rel-A system